MADDLHDIADWWGVNESPDDAGDASMTDDYTPLAHGPDTHTRARPTDGGLVVETLGLQDSLLVPHEALPALGALCARLMGAQPTTPRPVYIPTCEPALGEPQGPTIPYDSTTLTPKQIEAVESAHPSLLLDGSRPPTTAEVEALRLYLRHYGYSVYRMRDPGELRGPAIATTAGVWHGMVWRHGNSGPACGAHLIPGSVLTDDPARVTCEEWECQAWRQTSIPRYGTQEGDTATFSRNASIESSRNGQHKEDASTAAQEASLTDPYERVFGLKSKGVAGVPTEVTHSPAEAPSHIPCGVLPCTHLGTMHDPQGHCTVAGCDRTHTYQPWRPVDPWQTAQQAAVGAGEGEA